MSATGETTVPAAELAWTGRIYSDGWVAAQGGTAAVMEPATGGTLGQIGMASTADVDRAAQSAQSARAAWAGALGGPAVLMLANVLHWGSFIAGLGVAAGVAGFVTLIARHRDDRDDDFTDGAVL